MPERQARAAGPARLDRFGTRLILACRFIPGGRTGVTVTCGLVGYRRDRFIAATAGAGVIWASYAFFLGRLGGKAFADRPWAGLLLALAAMVVLSAVVEVIRRVSARRGRRAATGEDRPDPVKPASQPPELERPGVCKTPASSRR